jgi:hypothetical protein
MRLPKVPKILLVVSVLLLGGVYADLSRQATEETPSVISTFPCGGDIACDGHFSYSQADSHSTVAFKIRNANPYAAEHFNRVRKVIRSSNNTKLVDMAYLVNKSGRSVSKSVAGEFLKLLSCESSGIIGSVNHLFTLESIRR